MCQSFQVFMCLYEWEPHQCTDPYAEQSIISAFLVNPLWVLMLGECCSGPRQGASSYTTMAALLPTAMYTRSRSRRTLLRATTCWTSLWMWLQASAAPDASTHSSAV